jgi:ATP-binding cassette subfamily B (MDR/TAP) protein 1
MATSRATPDSKENDKQTDSVADELHHDQEHEPSQQAGWKVLFGFTTRKHIPMLISGILIAIFAAATLPAMAVFFGLIFRQFSDYGAGKITASELLHNASNLCIYLTALCIACWFANSIYFSVFLAFGELQARSAREKIFNHLLQKNLEWYDMRENGTAAFLPSVQM